MTHSATVDAPPNWRDEAVRKAARWTTGVRQFVKTYPEPRSTEDAAWGPWTPEEALVALASSPQSQGAPRGWGLSWGAQTALRVMEAKAHESPETFDELVWALGAENSLAWPMALARMDGEKHAPKRWRVEPGVSPRLASERWHAGAERTLFERPNLPLSEWVSSWWPQLRGSFDWTPEACARVLWTWTNAGGGFSMRRHDSAAPVYSMLARALCESEPQAIHKFIALFDAGAPTDEKSDGVAIMAAHKAAARQDGFDALKRLAAAGVPLTSVISKNQPLSYPLLASVDGDPRSLLFIAETVSKRKGLKAVAWATKTLERSPHTGQVGLSNALAALEKAAEQAARQESEVLAAVAKKASKSATSDIDDAQTQMAQIRRL